MTISTVAAASDPGRAGDPGRAAAAASVTVTPIDSEVRVQRATGRFRLAGFEFDESDMIVTTLR